MRLHLRALAAGLAVSVWCSASLLAGTPAQSRVSIPQDMPGAAEFVGFLQHAGVVVREVTYSQVGALFRDTSEQGAFIRTNLGVVTMVLSGPSSADSFTDDCGKS